MGFTDFVSGAGLTLLEKWLSTRSYIVGHTPSQADVKVFEQLKTPPAVAEYPHAFRWYRHIASHKDEFSKLPGDPTKSYTAYGPEAQALAINPKDAPATAEEDDDDVDLFGSDDEEEDAEAAKVREERLAAYAQKKAGKTKPAAKSMVTLDIKPWDDETNMQELEKNVRTIEIDGLVWGGAKLVPIGYGIKKLQINFVVEDEKVSIDDLQARIEEDEDHVQSTDVAAMMKL